MEKFRLLAEARRSYASRLAAARRGAEAGIPAVPAGRGNLSETLSGLAVRAALAQGWYEDARRKAGLL